MKKRNKTFTKLLSIALVCVMLVTSMGAYGVPEYFNQNNFILSADYNAETVNMLRPNQDVIRNDTQNDFNISVEKNGMHHYAEGIINYNGNKMTYEASGILIEVVLESGDIGYVGNLVGEAYTEKTKEHINISLQAIPSKNEIMANITLGMVTDNKDIKLLIFGNDFMESKELALAFMPAKNEVVQESALVSTSSLDIGTKYRDIGYADKYINGQRLQLGAITLWGPNEMSPNTSTAVVYVKLNNNIANANTYTENYFTEYDNITATFGSGATYVLKTSDVNTALTEPFPLESSTSFSLPIPYYSVGFKLFWLPVNINHIDVTTNYGAHAHANKITWKVYSPIDAAWGGAGSSYMNAKSIKKGYVGKSEIKYFQIGDTYPAKTNIKASGIVKYSFCYFYPHSESLYTVSYSVNLNTISAEIDLI